MKTDRQFRERDATFNALIVVTAAVLALCGVFFGGLMYSPRNITSMGFQIPEFGFVALGMMLAFMLGGIDLSIIANANVSGIFASYVLTGQWGGLPEDARIPVAICVALVSSATLGSFNGFLIARLGVPSLIATLGTMTLYSGIGMALTSGKSVVGFPTAFTEIGIAKVGGVPVIFLIFVLILVALAFVMSYSGFGRKIYLSGSNPVASRFSAIDNEKVLFSVFVIIGVLAGLSGLTIISRVNSAKVGYGDAYSLQALIVCVIGGIHPAGGRGRVAGVAVAIALMQVLASAFTILQFSPYTTKLIWGLMLILVMGLTKEGRRFVGKMRILQSKSPQMKGAKQ
jgi:simple sugar transport system permease protein